MAVGGTVVLTNSSTTPQAPDTGRARIFFNSSGNLCSIDENAVVTTYGEGVTPEQVEDIVGNLLQDSSTINVTYNDAGNIITFDVIASAVDHDALLNFVTNEHINHSSVSILAGTGLSGGGDITTSRTLNIANTGVTAATYGSATQIAQIALNAQGQATSASNVTIAIPSTQITDFTEAAQDAVGAALTDSASVDFTYNDASNQITAAVLPAGVDHNSLANLTTGNPHTQYLLTTTAASTYQPLDGDLTALASLAGTGLITRTATNTMTTRTVTAGTGISVSNGDGISGNPTVTNTDLGSTAVSTHVGLADPHTQYTLETRQINAGTGLSGGGDLTADRTISMPNVGTAGTYGTSTTYPIITTDAQGRVSSVTTQTVSALFGSEFESFEDLTTATTTSVTFSNGAAFTTASVPAGTYRIGIFWNWSINVTNADARFQLQVDGVNAGPEMRIEVSETATQSNWDSGFLYVTFASAATHTINLQFAVETAGNTLSLFQTRAEFWRVS